MYPFKCWQETVAAQWCTLPREGIRSSDFCRIPQWRRTAPVSRTPWFFCWGSRRQTWWISSATHSAGAAGPQRAHGIGHSRQVGPAQSWRLGTRWWTLWWRTPCSWSRRGAWECWSCGTAAQSRQRQKRSHRRAQCHRRQWWWLRRWCSACQQGHTEFCPPVAFCWSEMWQNMQEFFCWICSKLVPDQVLRITFRRNILPPILHQILFPAFNQHHDFPVEVKPQMRWTLDEGGTVKEGDGDQVQSQGTPHRPGKSFWKGKKLCFKKVSYHFPYTPAHPFPAQFS